MLSDVVVAVNLCQVIREINDEDRKIWQDQLKDYLEDVEKSSF